MMQALEPWIVLLVVVFGAISVFYGPQAALASLQMILGGLLRLVLGLLEVLLSSSEVDRSSTIEHDSDLDDLDRSIRKETRRAAAEVDRLQNLLLPLLYGSDDVWPWLPNARAYFTWATDNFQAGDYAGAMQTARTGIAFLQNEIARERAETLAAIGQLEGLIAQHTRGTQVPSFVLEPAALDVGVARAKLGRNENREVAEARRIVERAISKIEEHATTGSSTPPSGGYRRRGPRL
jgi:hypothetical protein